MENASEKELLERLNEGKMVQFAPQGISMLPYIRGGKDRVLVRKEEKVKIGDVVLARHLGRLILHRVYAIEGTTFVLMGDGNLKGCERVEAKDVLATVLQVVSPDGYCHRLGKAWLWRHCLPVRRVLLKVFRKWNKIMKK